MARKLDGQIRKLDHCMQALSLMRVCYDPLFDDSTPYGIIARITAGTSLGEEDEKWLCDHIGDLHDATTNLNVQSGMLVEALALLESILTIATSGDDQPDEVFAWWKNRSNKSPEPTEDQPQ